MYIVIAIIAFGILIAVHELGHFATARLFKVKVNEFALGMGPRIWSKTSDKSGTVYALRVLPIGGFCAMEGEDENSDDPAAFTNKTWWQQCIILIAGAVANVLLGYIILVVLLATDGFGLLASFRGAFLYSIEFVKMIYQSIVMLFTGQAGISDLSGPVGIVSAVGEVAKQSASAVAAAQNVAFFFAFIAVNLGVMNMLPIPALDGGRVLFTLLTATVEKILRRKVSRKAEGYIHAGAFVLLLGLMAFTLFNDIYKIVK